MKKIYFGSDHAGLALKTKLLHYLEHQNKYHLFDLGTNEEKSCDYPDFADKVCLEVINNPHSTGVLICGTGIGMSMVANRYKDIRAALCSFEFHAKASRAHNNANVLCIGARVTGEEIAKNILDTFLYTPFEGGRHLDRLSKFS